MAITKPQLKTLIPSAETTKTMLTALSISSLFALPFAWTHREANLLCRGSIALSSYCWLWIESEQRKAAREAREREEKAKQEAKEREEKAKQDKIDQLDEQRRFIEQQIRELEDYRQTLELDRKATQLELIEEKQRIEREFDLRQAEWQARLDNLEMENLELSSPIGYSDPDIRLRRVLSVFRVNEIAARWVPGKPPQDLVTSEVYWLALNDPSDLDKALKMSDQVAHELGSGTVKIEALRGMLRVTWTKQGKPASQEKADRHAAIERNAYPLADLKYEASGIILAGNSGAGKTSVALKCLGILTEDEPKEIVALDIHARKNHWHEHGIPTLYRADDIMAALVAINTELTRRSEQGIDSPELIVVLDEIGALKARIKQDYPDPKEARQAIYWIDSTLLRLGAEGRKFGVCLVAINQSKNVSQMGIDGQNRNNYLLILLNAAARDYTNTAGWGNDDPRTQYLNEKAYCAMVSGCTSDRVLAHPTHGNYAKYKKEGLEPIGLQPISAVIQVRMTTK